MSVFISLGNKPLDEAGILYLSFDPSTWYNTKLMLQYRATLLTAVVPRSLVHIRPVLPSECMTSFGHYPWSQALLRIPLSELRNGHTERQHAQGPAQPSWVCLTAPPSVCIQGMSEPGVRFHFGFAVSHVCSWAKQSLGLFSFSQSNRERVCPC